MRHPAPSPITDNISTASGCQSAC